MKRHILFGGGRGLSMQCSGSHTFPHFLIANQANSLKDVVLVLLESWCCLREKRKKEGRGERGGGGVGRGDGTSGGLIKPSWWFWVSNHTCDAQGNHKIGCKYKGVWQWWVRDAIDNFRKALENQRPWLAKKRWLNKMWHTLMTK